MKNRNRIMAVLMAAALATTSFTAFAADDFPSDSTATGNGVVEYDNSEAPDYIDVVLPTIASGTYDFTLDPSGLLNDYNSEVYTTDKTAYFKSVADGAMISDKLTEDGKLYQISYAEESTPTWTNIIDVNSGNGTITVAPGYYVWVPNTNVSTKSSGFKGKYEALTSSNYSKYINVVIAESSGTFSLGSATLKTGKVNDGTSSAFDGKIYKETFTGVDISSAVDVSALSDYINVSYNASGVATVNNVKNLAVIAKDESETGEYLKDLDSNGKYTLVTKDNLGTYVDISDATFEYSDTSETSKIVNKSSKDAVVTAKVSVTTPGTLEFATSSAMVQNAETASVYLALNTTTGAGITTVGASPVKGTKKITALEKVSTATTASVTATFDLSKPKAATEKYQDAAKDNDTGSHNYIQYESAVYSTDKVYDSVEFSITAEASTYANAGDSWDAYVETMKGTAGNARPGLNVVYSIKEKEEEPEVPPVVDAAPSIDVTTYNVKDNSILKNGALEIDVTPGTGSYSDVTVTKIEYRWTDGLTYDDSGATYDEGSNKITVPAAFVTSAQNVLPADKEFQLIVTFSDTTQIELTITNR